MSYIYLATPYSHKSELVRHHRYLEAETACAQLMLQGTTVYSPIVHCHMLAKRHKLPKDFKFWETHNYAMLQKASLMVILMLDGWELSEGIKGEREFALVHNIQIRATTYPVTEIIRV